MQRWISKQQRRLTPEHEQQFVHDPIGLNFDMKVVEEYLKPYKKADEDGGKELLLLLQYCEMIIFHSLILLMNSQQPIDQQDQRMYHNEFQKLI